MFISHRIIQVVCALQGHSNTQHTSLLFTHHPLGPCLCLEKLSLRHTCAPTKERMDGEGTWASRRGWGWPLRTPLTGEASHVATWRKGGEEARNVAGRSGNQQEGLVRLLMFPVSPCRSAFPPTLNPELTDTESRLVEQCWSNQTSFCSRDLQCSVPVCL